MDTITATLVGLGILAVVVIFFFIRFGGKGKFRIKTKFGEANAEGENAPPPTAVAAGVRVSGADAGRDIRAHSSSAGGVDVEKAKAGGGISATHTPAGRAAPKKVAPNAGEASVATTVQNAQVGGNLIVAQHVHVGSTSPLGSGLTSELDAQKPGLAPPLPSLIVGREEALRELKRRLGVGSKKQEAVAIQVVTAVRGWPGVGKTTVAAALAHDPEIRKAFHDGVLWTSLSLKPDGQSPDILSQLATWGRALGTDDLLRCRDIAEATKLLAGLLRNKRMLLIVDDAWEAEHVVPFQAGGAGCAMLVTTRINTVAQAIAPTPDAIYKLAVLTEEKAIELLGRLAPTVVAANPEESLKLVRELEGLPLAIQVAGHLLNVEAAYGFGVSQLLAELQTGAKLLEAKAPADRADLANQTTPTVAALLQQSTQRLDPETRERFAFLGAFAPKPASFDLRAMGAVWELDDPKPTVRVLVDRGLLEPADSGRFQMHALLVLHARSLCLPE